MNHGDFKENRFSFLNFESLFFGKRLFVFFFVSFFVLLIYYLFTGLFVNASLDISFSPVMNGDNVDGQLKFSLDYGELLPVDTKLVVSYGDEKKEFFLSELMDEETVLGNYYVENKLVNGSGEGYGSLGRKYSYPDVFFILNVIDIVDDEDSAVKKNVEDENETESDEVLEENATSEEFLEESSEESEVVSESEDEESVEVQENTAEENLSFGSSNFIIFPMTGAVVSEDGFIEGKVSKNNVFTYNLERGKSIELVSGSVKTSEKSLDDSDVNVDVKGIKVEVSTDYAEYEEGFGEDYLTEDKMVFEIDLTELNLNVTEGDLTISLVYGDEELIKGTKKLASSKIKSDENETNLTVSQEIIENNTLIINETLSNQTISNETIVVNGTNLDISTIQLGARIGEKVKWKKNIKADKEGEIKVELPEIAENVSVYKLKEKSKEEGNGKENVEDEKKSREKVHEEKFTVKTQDVFVDISYQRNEEFLVANYFQTFLSFITGSVVDLNDDKVKEVIIDAVSENSTDFEIEYETEAPQSLETETSSGKEIIISGPDEVHYENVLAFTELGKEVEASKIHLYHLNISGNEIIKQEVPTAKYDTNNNSLVDYIEWVVPSLSNQTYELIIEISKAEHLDSNKNFVSDIYDEVKALDGNWSETINDGDYVRVTFESNLTKERDITVYPRVVNGMPSIDVYEKDGVDVIASFETLNQNEYNKVYLTGLEGIQDTFDLKVVGGSVEFEHVIDPATFFYVRANATGTNNGSDWDNAWNEMDQINWIVIQPGDTIYVAGGNYTSALNIGASGNATHPITIKRTTESPYNTIAEIPLMTLGSNQYVVVNGSENYGFKFTSGGTNSHIITDSPGASDITLTNFEIEGLGYRACNSSRGMNIQSNNILIDNANIHDFSSVGIRLIGNTNVTIQNSRLHNIASLGDAICVPLVGITVHYEHIAVFDGVSNITIQNNVFSQQYEGDIAGGFAMSHKGTNGEINVLNNVFFNIQYQVYINSDGLGSVDSYNVDGNTFVGYRVPIGGAPNSTRNNIFCNLDSYFNSTNTRNGYTGGTHNFYCYDSRYVSNYNAAVNSQVLGVNEHPFVNYTGDWHLNQTTESGVTLLANTDLDGNVRGADGVWDRGAYEYQSSLIENSFYVRANATGTNNGSDWNNAYTSLPSTLQRNATYYIADGNYSGYIFNDTINGSQYITIKKATSSDHGTDTEWNVSYGDGQAEFGSLTFSTSYYIFNGSSGGGPDQWKTNHGFEVQATPPDNCGDNGNLITIGANVGHIIVSHSWIHSLDYDYPIAGVKGINGANNLTFNYNYINSTFGPSFHIGSWDDITIEKNFISDVRSTGAGDPFCSDWHAEGISSLGSNKNMTIKNNIWNNIGGTAVIAGVNIGNSTDWDVYGNIFSNSVTTIYYYHEGSSSSNQQFMEGLEFYNNVITGQNGVSQGGIVINNGSNNKVYNNIWYDNDANLFVISGTKDSNYFSGNIRTADCSPACEKDSEGASGDSNAQITSVNPFVNWTGGADPATANFTLSNATNAGVSLSSPFNIDMFGNVRGADGVWDRGAYEYQSGGVGDSLPTVTLVAPTNGTTTDSDTHSFNVTFTDDSNLVNATFYLWNSTNDVVNQSTRSLTGTTGSLNLSVTLSSTGTYSWNYLAYDNASQGSFATSNFSLTYSVSDNEYPLFSSFTDNNATYAGQFADFNATITSTNGTAFVEINGTNYTASNISASVFNVSVNLTSAGVYDYYWGSWGNGSSSNYNVSATRSFSVNATSSCNLTSANWSVASASEGVDVGLNVNGNNCGSDSFNYTIYRHDLLNNSFVTSFIGNYSNTTWSATRPNSFYGDPFYYFTATVSNNQSENVTSLDYLRVTPPISYGAGNFDFTITLRYNNGTPVNNGTFLLNEKTFDYGNSGPQKVRSYLNYSNSDGVVVISNVSSGNDRVYTMESFVNNSGVISYIGPSLQPFPSEVYEYGISGSDIYLEEAVGLNITVYYGNDSGLYMGRSYDIVDSEFGNHIGSLSDFTDTNGLVYLPLNGNYSFNIHPNESAPFSVAYGPSECLNSDGASAGGVVSCTINGTVLFKHVSGHVLLEGSASFSSFNGINYIVESGNRVFSDNSYRNVGLFEGGNSDVYNSITGEFNVTVPAVETGFDTLMLFFAVKDGNYYGAMYNTSLDFGSSDIDAGDLNLVPLYGSAGSFGVKDFTGSNIDLNTKVTTFNLIQEEAFGENPSGMFTEMKVTYPNNKQIKWTFAPREGGNSIKIPLLNGSQIETNVFAAGISPKKVTLNSEKLSSQSSFDIKLRSFERRDIHTNEVKINNVKIEMFNNKLSSCNVPLPSSSCSLVSFSDANASNVGRDSFKVMLLGKANVKMTDPTSNVSVMYVGVNLENSNAPPADFGNSPDDSEETDSTLDELWKFGSNGPQIYDYAFAILPYNETKINESSSVVVNITSLYDTTSSDNWSIEYNSSSQNSSYVSQLSHYSTRYNEWTYLLQGTTCLENSVPTTTNPCSINKTDNDLYLRIPHFSGASISVSGDLNSEEETPSSGGSPGGGGGSGGGSGGGGGSASVSVLKSSLNVNPETWSVQLKQGKTKEFSIQLSNPTLSSLTVELTSDLNEFIVLKESSVTLEPGESKVVDIDIIVREDVIPNLYVGHVFFTTGNLQKQLSLSIDVSSKGSLFDVSLKILDGSLSVLRGGILSSEISLTKLIESDVEDVTIKYEVRNLNNETVFMSTDTRAVQTTLSYIKEIQLSPDISEGDYVLHTEVSYDGKVASSSSFFKIRDENFIFKFLRNNLLYVYIGIGVLVFVVGVYFSMKKFGTSKHKKRKKK